MASRSDEGRKGYLATGMRLARLSHGMYLSARKIGTCCPICRQSSRSPAFCGFGMDWRLSEKRNGVSIPCQGSADFRHTSAWKRPPFVCQYTEHGGTTGGSAHERLGWAGPSGWTEGIGPCRDQRMQRIPLGLGRGQELEAGLGANSEKNTPDTRESSRVPVQLNRNSGRSEDSIWGE